MSSQLDSISLSAREPQKLCDFYVSVFGLEEDKERSHPPGFFLIRGGRGCNLLVMEAAGAGLELGSKGFELGFEVETLQGLTGRVNAAGGEIIEAEQQMQWGQSVVVADPEGHRINAYTFRR